MRPEAPTDVLAFTAAAWAVAVAPHLLQQCNAALMLAMRLCAGASRRGELPDSADRTDEHYQHASSAADSAGDAVDEASTSAARRLNL